MIKSIFKQSFNWTKDKKDFFVLLFFTQSLYLGVFIYIFVTSFLQIMQHVNYLLDFLYSITPEQISANLVENPLGVYAHYNSFVNAVVILIIFSYLAYMILNGMNWSLTNKLVNVNQKFLRFFPKFIIFTLIFTIPLIIICYFFTRLIAVAGMQTLFLTLMMLVILVFWYFMGISFGLIERYRIKEFKHHLFKTFEVGVKKAGTLVPITLFIVVLLIFLGAMIYLTVEIFWLSVLFVVLFILALVWTRILCMTAVREASHGHIVKVAGLIKKKK